MDGVKVVHLLLHFVLSFVRFLMDFCRRDVSFVCAGGWVCAVHCAVLYVCVFLLQRVSRSCWRTKNNAIIHAWSIDIGQWVVGRRESRIAAIAVFSVLVDCL